MFYLGCDQHARQVTICLRNEAGDVVLKRQVSTDPERMHAFLDDLARRTADDGGYLAIVEVCGFNDWFVKLLQLQGCLETVLVQSQEQATRKTDRRDAAQLITCWPNGNC